MPEGNGIEDKYKRKGFNIPSFLIVSITGSCNLINESSILESFESKFFRSLMDGNILKEDHDVVEYCLSRG